MAGLFVVSIFHRFLLLLIKQQFEMCVTDLSGIPRRGGGNRTKICVFSSPVGLKIVQNVILFGAAPPSSFSLIYKHANYNANANTTE